MTNWPHIPIEGTTDQAVDAPGWAHVQVASGQFVAYPMICGVMVDGRGNLRLYGRRRFFGIFWPKQRVFHPVGEWRDVRVLRDDPAERVT